MNQALNQKSQNRARLGHAKQGSEDGLGANVWAGNGRPWGRQVGDNMRQYVSSMERELGSRREHGHRI